MNIASQMVLWGLFDDYGPFTSITTMDDVREAYHASLRNWNTLVDLHGEDSPEAKHFQQGTVNVLMQREGDAAQALLEIEPVTPVELLCKIVAVKNGDADFIHENGILLLDQARRLLSST